MLDIFVCGVEEVNEYIDEVDGVISIMNPGYTIFAPRSITIKETENRHSVLRLEFDDVWQETYRLGLEIVSEEILALAIDFASDLVERYGKQTNLLIHCHEGISRSSGIAIAIYTALYGEPERAVERIAHQRPQAVPNLEIIRLTDTYLNLQGKLLEVAWQVFYRSLT